MPHVRNYTPLQITRFIELAHVHSVPKARAILGYPTHSAGYKWMKRYGDQATVGMVAIAAGQRVIPYGDRECIEVLSTILDRVHVMAQQDDATPDDLSKLANAAERCIGTMRLVAGQSTQTVEVIDSMDSELKHMLEAVQARNQVAQPLTARVLEPAVTDAEVVDA